MTYMSRDKRREQIMDAVVDLVVSEGLAAATVRRIAQALDCSPGQIHHHFASADALRAEAVREFWRRIEPEFDAMLARLPPRERLMTLLADCSTKFTDVADPVVAQAQRLWTEAWNTRSEPGVREAIAEAITEIRAEVVSTLQDGIARGMFPPRTDPAKLSLALLAASQGYDVLSEICPVNDLGLSKAEYIDDVLKQNGI